MPQLLIFGGRVGLVAGLVTGLITVLIGSVVTQTLPDLAAFVSKGFVLGGGVVPVVYGAFLILLRIETTRLGVVIAWLVAIPSYLVGVMMPTIMTPITLNKGVSAATANVWASEVLTLLIGVRLSIVAGVALIGMFGVAWVIRRSAKRG